MRKLLIGILFLTIGTGHGIFAQNSKLTKEKGNETDSIATTTSKARRLPPRPQLRKKESTSDTIPVANKRERRLPQRPGRQSSSEKKQRSSLKDDRVKEKKAQQTKSKSVKSDRKVSTQDVKKIETKYFRPSITTLFVQPKSTDQNIVITKFKNLEPVERFDAHNIQFNDLKSLSDIGNYVQAASNPIIAKWWARDQQGNFNYSLVAQRAAYTSTDADAITSRSANTSRIEMLGEQLIDRSYVLVYEINDLYDMEQYYDRVDKKNRNKKDYQPVKRTDKGYKCDYTVYVYKINFGDSVAKEFYDRYWVDEKNHDNTKVAAWANARFPVMAVTRVNNTVSSTQSKTPSPYIKQLTMLELLEGIPSEIQKNAFTSLNVGIEDFKLKTTVFSAYPVMAKIGNKEGLKTDQRFFIYEIEEEANGNQKAIRKGVVRAKKIVNNKGVATGSTETSQFYQVNGKHLYPGMFMKSKEDLGLVLGLGYKYSGSMIGGSGNLAMGGYNASLDLNISQTLRRGTTGLYLGVEGSLVRMNDVEVVTTNGTLSDGIAYTFGLHLAKEVYFLNTGNIYIRPLIGGGLQGYSFKNLNGGEISKDNKKDYTWNSWFLQPSLGLGFNISPSLAFEVKPGYYYRLKADTKGSKVKSFSPSDWGFESVDKGSGGFSVSGNLRIRF